MLGLTPGSASIEIRLNGKFCVSHGPYCPVEGRSGGGGNALGGECFEDGVGIKVGRHERHVRRSRRPSERSPPREIRRDLDRSSASETKRGRGERAGWRQGLDRSVDGARRPCAALEEPTACIARADSEATRASRRRSDDRGHGAVRKASWTSCSAPTG
jgi:hypothetical protein